LINKLKKPVYLLLALLLPILIFIFLKFAGKNEFNIPIYYEKGVDSTASGCGIVYPVPYVLSPSAMVSQKNWHAANVLVFSQANIDFHEVESGLYDEFDKNELWIGNADLLAADSTTTSLWRDCILFARKPYQTVLFDEKGRIRGYYDVSLREEVDRLRVELKVLLRKY